MVKKFFLVLDIGTSGTKGVLFDRDLILIKEERLPLTLSHPKKGCVEQDPNDLFQKSVRVLRQVLKKASIKQEEVIALGITNQRETTILFDKKTGASVYPAIVWEDMRTQSTCKKFEKQKSFVRRITGLMIDPYFSATKIAWILKHIPKAKKLLEEGHLRFGTVDTWILFHLTRGAVHATDETNASRTLLFDVHKRSWNQALLNLFGVSSAILPTVKRSQDDYGSVHASIFGTEIPIRALCGDQQSSLYAAGSVKGTTKVTYGTGAFIGQHLGAKYRTHNPFFTTFMPSGRHAHYALEGKIARGGKEVEPLLNNQEKLRKFLLQLAKHVDGLLKQLPLRTKKIFIDGGVMRDGIVGSFQEKISHVHVRPLSVVNGTAYGTAKLLKESTEDT